MYTLQYRLSIPIVSLPHFLPSSQITNRITRWVHSTMFSLYGERGVRSADWEDGEVKSVGTQQVVISSSHHSLIVLEYPQRLIILFTRIVSLIDQHEAYRIFLQKLTLKCKCGLFILIILSILFLSISKVILDWRRLTFRLIGRSLNMENWLPHSTASTIARWNITLISCFRARRSLSK